MANATDSYTNSRPIYENVREHMPCTSENAMLSVRTKASGKTIMLTLIPLTFITPAGGLAVRPFRRTAQDVIVDQQAGTQAAPTNAAAIEAWEKANEELCGIKCDSAADALRVYLHGHAPKSGEHPNGQAA